MSSAEKQCNLTFPPQDPSLEKANLHFVKAAASLAFEDNGKGVSTLVVTKTTLYLTS